MRFKVKDKGSNKIYFLFAADDDVPSESQCRPYIEKALKELETGDAEHGTFFLIVLNSLEIGIYSFK